MEVSVDVSYCGGCGGCAVIAPEVFKLARDGARVKQGKRILASSNVAIVPIEQETKVLRAASECEDQIIAVDYVYPILNATQA